MPNWIGCDLTVTGAGDAVDRFVAAAEGDGSGRRYFSDRSVGPLERQEMAQVQLLRFERLVPIPPYLLAQPYSGSAYSGYDWEYEHWGCKWGATDVDRTVRDHPDGKEAVYIFSTPNAPPLEWLEAVAQRWPEVNFYLTYQTEDQAGEVRYENGHCRLNSRRTVTDPEELLEFGMIDEEEYEEKVRARDGDSGLASGAAGEAGPHQPAP